MNATHPSRAPALTTLAALLISCSLIACGGGGGGDTATTGSQSVTPTTPGTTPAAADAASSPASAASAAGTAADTAAAPGALANASKSGEGTIPTRAGNGSPAASSTPVSTAPAPAPAPSSTLIAAPAPALPTPLTPPATVGNGSTGHIVTQADSTPTANPAAPAPTVADAPCTVRLSKTFGEACYAAASAELASGGAATFPNTRAGYRGSITASCSNGTVTWSASNCTYIASVPKEAVNAAAAATTTPAPASSYRIGTYYFPGWKSNQVGNERKHPWDAIKLYTDREPALGWYAEDGPGVMTQQLKWMRDYGIDYVVFDSYWGADNRAPLTAGIDAYLNAPDRYGVEFSVMWANHTPYIFSKSQFEALFEFWATNYFQRADYVKLDGKPVVFIFSPETLDNNAQAIGVTTQALVAMAASAAKAKGLPGITFIGSGARSSRDYSASSGYQGFSAYNYHSPASIALTPLRPENVSRSYAELDTSYQNQWSWMQKNGSGTYVTPMTSGWDKRPWGGSKDPLHDDSRSTPGEFRNHLLAARNFIDKYPTLTRRMGVICCWNEYGEGSFIEPTKVDGVKYLEQIRDVFGTH